MKYCKKIKNIVSWVSAALGAFVVINIVCFLYNYDPSGCVRDGGAFYTTYQPGRTIINMQEGFGISHVDDNGYLNDSADLCEDGYVLILGNSMTNAVQVNHNQKYASLLNSKFQEKYMDNHVHSYLMARPGSDFAEAAQGVEAAVNEFPQAKAIVIQIVGGMLYYTSPSLEGVYNQRFYDYSQKPSVIISNQSVKGKLKTAVKDYVPVVAFLKHERNGDIKKAFDGAFLYRKSDVNDVTDWTQYKDDEEDGVSVELSIDEEIDRLTDLYRDSMQAKELIDVLDYIKGKTTAQIIILDLASEDIMPNGKISVNTANTDMWKYACYSTDTIFVETKDLFEEMYSDGYKLAYGFSNTMPAYGHLNRLGHQAVAERLYDVLVDNGVL